MQRFILALFMLLPLGAQAEVNQLRVTRQPSIIYLPLIIMEQQRLVEAEAIKLGLPGLATTYTVFNSGGTATDSMLAGSLDIVTTGVSNMILLWDRTRGGVKGLGAASALPLLVVTRNPAVKSLRDLTQADRIALPTIKVSIQAILLQIAARQMFGDSEFAHFDATEVTMGHPDGVAALISGNVGVTVHFSAPPYQEIEAATPGLHAIGSSYDILGQPLSNPVFFATTKFHDANPTVMHAFVNATRVASRFIAERPREAAELYLKATGEKYDVGQLVSIIGDGAKTFDTTPRGMKRIADHMADIKMNKMRPESWKDMFFPEVHDRPGN